MLNIAEIIEAAREGALKFYIDGCTLYVQSAITGERAAIGTEKRTFENSKEEKDK